MNNFTIKSFNVWNYIAAEHIENIPPVYTHTYLEYKSLLIYSKKYFFVWILHLNISVLAETLNCGVNIFQFAEYINYMVKSKMKDPVWKTKQTTIKGRKSLSAYLHIWLVTRSIIQSVSSVVRTVYSGARRADALRLPINPSVLCFTLQQREGRGGRTAGVQSERTNSCPRSQCYQTASTSSVHFLSLWPTQSKSS